MTGPNLQTWYSLLFGWTLGWMAGDYAILFLLVIGVAAVVADKFVEDQNEPAE